MCEERELHCFGLEHSKRKSAGRGFGQRFQFERGGHEVSVCLQKNEAARKRSETWAGDEPEKK